MGEKEKEMVKVTIIKGKPQIKVEDKPFKGRIKHWTKQVNPVYPDLFKEITVKGYYLDHPDFKGEWGLTSRVVKLSPQDKDGNIRLETTNSKYVLVGKELTWEQYRERRASLEKDALAYKLLTINTPSKDTTIAKPSTTKLARTCGDFEKSRLRDKAVGR